MLGGVRLGRALPTATDLRALPLRRVHPGAPLGDPPGGGAPVSHHVPLVHVLVAPGDLGRRAKVPQQKLLPHVARRVVPAAKLPEPPAKAAAARLVPKPPSFGGPERLVGSPAAAPLAPAGGARRGAGVGVDARRARRVVPRGRHEERVLVARAEVLAPSCRGHPVHHADAPGRVVADRCIYCHLHHDGPHFRRLRGDDHDAAIRLANGHCVGDRWQRPAATCHVGRYRSDATVCGFYWTGVGVSINTVAGSRAVIL